MNSRIIRGGLGLIAAAALLAVIAPAGSPAEAAAPEVSGVVIRYGQSFNNSRDIKSLDVPCRSGEKAVGGGAEVDDDHGGSTAQRVTLYRSAPTAYGWAVTAATIPSTTGDWWVRAHAVCAKVDSLENFRIVSDVTESSSSSSPKTTEAHCPSGQRALGSGAMIMVSSGAPDNAKRGLGLQVVRASGDGRLTRAQARETAAGNLYDWRLVGFATCADIPPGYEVKGAASYEDDSEPRKYAWLRCPGGKKALGAGAAVTNVAPGNAMLNDVIPYPDGVWASAGETTETTQDWDFMVAQAICVD